MTIKEAQQAVDQWIREYGVRYFSELTNMAVLTEEVGELARVMARKYGDQSFKAGEQENLGDEMADILWVLICLANQTGIVYMCISGNAAEVFGRVGNVMNETLISIMKVIPDRVEMANRAMDIAYKANEEAEKAKAEHGDLFSGKEGSCS